MEPRDDNTIEEQSKSRQIWRRYLLSATTLLAAINLVVFLITDLTAILTGKSPWLSAGSAYWVAFFRNHEYYRPLTSMFLHVDSDHISNNMMALFFMGNFLEQHIGTLRYIILYFFTGILASCTSMVYNMLRAINSSSVGASGAIFGIMGGLLAYALFYRGKPDNLSPGQLLFAIVLSIGYGSGRVDQVAHISGFIIGFLLILIFRLFPEKHHP